MTPAEVLELCRKQRGWWQRWCETNPGDAARDRRIARERGWVARCDDPKLEVRCSELESLARVALAACGVVEALGSLEDLSDDERAALELLRGVA